MYGNFPAKNTIYTPYIPINVWFWPTLFITQRTPSYRIPSVGRQGLCDPHLRLRQQVCPCEHPGGAQRVCDSRVLQVRPAHNLFDLCFAEHPQGAQRVCDSRVL